MAYVARAVFHENNKCYKQVFLDESPCKLKIINKKTCYAMIELKFMK